ncbi:hypothetical protein REPUB_Repub13aG0111900 [Reevesia pubescens]
MWMAMASTASVLTAVRVESCKSNGGVPAPPPLPHSLNPMAELIANIVVEEVFLLYMISCLKDKPSSYRDASQRRTTKMVRTCGGSGLSYCSRCLGTGEYRYIMGFHFKKRDADHTQDNKYQIQGDRGSHNAADRLLHCEQNNSGNEI